MWLAHSSAPKAPACVLEAKVKLIHSPQQRSLVGLGYTDAFDAADHVMEILEFGPLASKVLKAASSMASGRKTRAESRALIPEGGGFLLVEFGADDPEARPQTSRGNWSSA